MHFARILLSLKAGRILNFAFLFMWEVSALTNNGTYFQQEIFINLMYYPTSIENVGFNFIRVDSEHCIIAGGINFEIYLTSLIKCLNFWTLGSIFTVYNVMVLVV